MSMGKSRPHSVQSFRRRRRRQRRMGGILALISVKILLTENDQIFHFSSIFISFLLTKEKRKIWSLTENNIFTEIIAEIPSILVRRRRIFFPLFGFFVHETELYCVLGSLQYSIRSCVLATTAKAENPHIIWMSD